MTRKTGRKPRSAPAGAALSPNHRSETGRTRRVPAVGTRVWLAMWSQALGNHEVPAVLTEISLRFRVEDATTGTEYHASTPEQTGWRRR